jgi:dTMP kinase
MSAAQKPQFITFEGGEGSGKSTQIKLLHQELMSREIQVGLTREPGGSEGAEEIRELIVNGDKGRWDAWSETLLLWAARRDHVENVIKPALARGSWILCDRFFDSTIAYQGYAGGLPIGDLRRLQEMVLGNFGPTKTIFFDIDPKIGLERTVERGLGKEGRFESFDLTFHQRLYDGFKELALQEPDRIVTVDANQPVESVQRDVLKAVGLN